MLIEHEFDVNKLIDKIEDRLCETQILLQQESILDNARVPMNISDKEFIDMINEETAVDEGIVDSIVSGIKVVVKKAIELLVKLWNKLVEIVKGIVEKIKNFLKVKDSDDKTNDTKLEKPIKTQVITIESAKLKELNINTNKDLFNNVLQAIDRISSEIHKRSQIQIACTKKLESMNYESTNEAKVMYGKTTNGHLDVTNPYMFSAKKTYKLSLQGKDIIDTKMQQDIALFDKKATEKVLEAKNIVEEYNNWMDNIINAIKKKCDLNGNATKDASTLDSMIVTEIYILKTLTNPNTNKKYTDPEINSYIKGSFFDFTNNPDHIKRFITLRLNYNKKIVSLLSEMVRTNYTILGINKEEVETLVSGIMNNDKRSIHKVEDEIRKHVKDYLVRPGFLDFRKLGGGVVFFRAGEELMDLNNIDPIPIFNLSLRWDCIINTHGSGEEKYSRESKDKFKKINDWYDKESEKLDTEDKRITKLLADAGANKNMDKVIELAPKTEEIMKKKDELLKKKDKLLKEIMPYDKKWVCMPIKVGNHPETNEVNTAIQYAIDDGYKRIYVLVCNPGNIAIPKSILKQKGIVIHISHSSMIANANLNLLYSSKGLNKNSKESIANTLYKESSMSRVDDEIQHQVLDDKQTEDWRSMSGKVILYSHYDTEKELREDWDNFQNQPVDHQREANWKSIEIYGFPNQERYEKMLSVFLQQPIADDLEDIRYNPKTSYGQQSKFIEDLKHYAKNNDMITALETANYIKSIVHNAYKEIQEGIKEQLDYDNKVNFNLTPYFTPEELKFLGLSYLQGPSKYSDEPDNVLIGDKTTKEWINEYKNKTNGFNSSNYTSASTWKETIQKLYYDYDLIKESENIDKINSRKQSILDLGWNPDIDFNESNIEFASKRFNKFINKQNSRFKIIDIGDTKAVSESTFPNSQKEKPLFLIFYSLYPKNILKYDHIGLSFTYKLDEIYGYTVPGASTAHKTSITEIQEESVDHIEVYAIFLTPEELERIQNMIGHSFNFSDISDSQLMIDNVKTVCTSFITSMMNRLYKDSTIQTDIKFEGNIYKIYHGDPDMYDNTKTISSIAHLYTGAMEESFSFIYKLAIHEAKEFPIQFNQDGDLLISKGKDLDFEGEFSRTHLALQQYEKAKDLDGMKYSVCKLWYMNIILEENIYDPDKKDKIKEYHKARAKILNDLKKYMKIIMKYDNTFNIAEEYKNSPFNNDTIKIKRSTIKYALELIKQLIGLRK